VQTWLSVARRRDSKAVPAGHGDHGFVGRSRSAGRDPLTQIPFQVIDAELGGGMDHRHRATIADIALYSYGAKAPEGNSRPSRATRVGHACSASSRCRDFRAFGRRRSEWRFFRSGTDSRVWLVAREYEMLQVSKIVPGVSWNRGENEIQRSAGVAERRTT